MGSSDLTIIYLTNNMLPESWEDFHMKHLKSAIGDSPVISISRKKMDFGDNLIQEEPVSSWNVYRQMLRGAKSAKTEYVGIAEDDTLYTPEHFSQFRPKNAVAYDMSRWSVFSWADPPMYSMRRRRGNFSMIAPKTLLTDALEERMVKHPNGHHRAGEVGRHDIERHLGVNLVDAVDWYCTNPIVNLCHPMGLSPAYPSGTRRRKRLGEMKAWDIPYWGKAESIVRHFNG